MTSILGSTVRGAGASGLGTLAMWFGIPFGAAVWADGYAVLPQFGVYEPIWKVRRPDARQGPLSPSTRSLVGQP